MITPAEVIALGITLPILDFVFVALRLWAKQQRKGRIAIDDILIIITLVCVWALGAVCIYGAIGAGFGHISPPSETINGVNAEDDEVLVRSKQLADTFNLMSPWTFGTAKLSVLFFYRSVFLGRAFNILSITMICTVCIWMVVSFLVLLLQCGSQVYLEWTSAANIAQKCLSGFQIAISISATDVFTDLLILLMPIYWVWKLHMSRLRRLSIIGVFLFGAVTIASSLLRLAEYSIVYPSHNTDPNQYAYLTTVVYYGVIEAGLCIVAACLPALGPLFTRAGRERLRYGSRYRFKGSNERSTGPDGTVRSNGRGFAAFGGRSNKHRSGGPQTWLSNISEVNFVPREPYDEFIGMDTMAVGNADGGENHEEGQGITVTTDINHDSFTVPIKEPRKSLEV